MTRKILTVTFNPSLDMNSEAHSVVPDRKLRCEQPGYEAGGGGVNVSRAIHRLGGASTVFVLVGGHHGKLLTQILEQEGITCEAHTVPGETRENVMIYEQGTGQQYRFTMPGCPVTEEQGMLLLNKVRRAVEESDLVAVSGSLPPGLDHSIFEQLALICHEKKARLVVDTSGEALRAAIEGGCYLIKPNHNEMNRLAGRELSEEHLQDEWVRTIIDSGQVQHVVVSLGAGGVLYGSAKGCHRLRAPAVAVKSRVGAGDSMMGGILWGMAQDIPMLECVRLGIAAGAAAVMTPGTELCRREDVERLFEDLKEK